MRQMTLPMDSDKPAGSCSGGARQRAQSHRRVTVVILTWNGIAYTKRCLKTLRANTDFPAYDIIVADNGSSDGTLEYLKAQNCLKTISNVKNLGFAKGIHPP